MDLDRRKFLQTGAILTAGVLLPRLQTPEQTPEVDPYAESDAANIELINTQIANSESNILEEREASEEEFTLEIPRVAGIIKLNNRAFIDLSFLALADSQGEVYAFATSHDVDDCFREPLEEAQLLENTQIEPVSSANLFSLISIRQVEITPVQEGVRLDSMQVERLVDNFRVISIDGEPTDLPLLVIKGFELNGQTHECPTLGEELANLFGGLADEVGERIDEFDLGETLEGAGEILGEAIGSFSEGFERGRGN